MESVAFVVAEGKGLPYHKSVGMLLVERKRELIGLAGAYAEEFIGAKEV